ELLFRVFADRYERGSILVTSNLPFSEWGQIFQGERMTAALLDRLTHHCAIFEMNGESYRFRESMKTKKSRKAERERVAAPGQSGYLQAPGGPRLCAEGGSRLRAHFQACRGDAAAARSGGAAGPPPAPPPRPAPRRSEARCGPGPRP